MSFDWKRCQPFIYNVEVAFLSRFCLPHASIWFLSTEFDWKEVYSQNREIGIRAGMKSSKESRAHIGKRSKNEQKKIVCEVDKRKEIEIEKKFQKQKKCIIN